MQLCRNCCVPMIGVMSFSKDGNEKFNRCPKCYAQSKHRKIQEKELDFGEVLYMVMHN